MHFAAFENHVGFYPTPSGIEAFKDELQRYKHAKGSVQFSLTEPLRWIRRTDRPVPDQWYRREERKGTAKV